MKYAILRADNEYALCKTVAEYIEKGWIPQGGVAVVSRGEIDRGPRRGDEILVFFQAMVV